MLLPASSSLAFAFIHFELTVLHLLLDSEHNIWLEEEVEKEDAWEKNDCIQRVEKRLCIVAITESTMYMELPQTPI
jgi:hypothetical protein